MVGRTSMQRKNDGLLLIQRMLSSSYIYVMEVTSVPLCDINEHLEECVPMYMNKTNGKLIEVQVPNASLEDISQVTMHAIADVQKVPKAPGNYWILTNEPVHHCLNAGTNTCKPLSNGLRVVYNGVSASLQQRAVQHLFSEEAKGGSGKLSGVSVDILQKVHEATSHVKVAWSTKKVKVPKLVSLATCKHPTSLEELLNALHITNEEKIYAANKTVLYFKNGIHVSDAKHKGFDWVFAYAPVSNHSIRDYVETEWRRRHGVPLLCSYKEGR